VDYYVMTRPLGWWGPVHAEAVRRGLIEPRVKSSPTGRRPLIKRKWTAEEAQDWTREDWIAIVLSPMVYGLIMFGLVNVLLLRPSGFTMLGLAVLGCGVIYWVIDPKLRAVSMEYELQQTRYVSRLEQRMNWDSKGAD
jgi:hypothetical protein